MIAMMHKIVLTGFEPFGPTRDLVNPSWEMVSNFPSSPSVFSNCDFQVFQIPLVYHSIHLKVQEILENEDPDIMICTGQSSSSMICVERVALNVADVYQRGSGWNCGAKPQDEILVEDGPCAYFSTLPIREIVTKIQEAKIPATVSNHAGTFGCNQIFYLLMYELEKRNKHIPAGFIHVPPLPIQAIDRFWSSMSLELMIKALEIALEVTLKKIG
ncbi:MAG: pyroglutamyl-peptidase I [Candidatus Hodarchaeota archaeon]